MSVSDILLQQLANGLILGSFYALVALGYTMVYGIIKLLNFAHGDIYMAGAFVGWVALGYFAGPLGDEWGGILPSMLVSMVLVGLPYSATGLVRLDEVTGGTPYGATTIAGCKGERQPSQNELDLARFQGRHVAEITMKLVS